MPPPEPSFLALSAVTPEALARRVAAVTLAEARKIVSAVHRELDVGAALRGEAPPPPQVRRVAVEALAAARAAVPALEIAAVSSSRVDPFVKTMLRAPDGAEIETVRIPLERAGRFSVCVSSQVGCALACAFCATGRMGLARNLETWEIVEQVRVVKRSLDARRGERVHGVVFQGMGEPMANLDRVLEAIAVLSDPSAGAIDARAMTVCTSGLPSGIRRLAREAPNVRLGISLGSALAATRRSLMPIEATHSLDEVLEAAAEHARVTQLSPMWALTLLRGVNDGPEHARALAVRVRAFAEATGGVRPRLSIIPYNAIDDDARDPFARTSDEAEAVFRDTLAGAGVHAHRRYSGGADVRAACGQLVTTSRARAKKLAHKAC